jgi:hypothetical protein
MRKNAVPAMKTCAVCGKDWIPATRYQAVRNQTCGRECAGKAISLAKAGTIIRPRTTCATCGEIVKQRPPSHQAKRQSGPYCSKRCWGLTRSEHMTAISALGVAAITPEDRAKGAMRGAKNPAWKGGVTHRRRRGNYVSVRYVRCPPELTEMSRRDGYVMEHRLVVARMVGRPLTRVECVHHVDHDPLNNEPRNLELWPDNRSHKLAEHGRFVTGAANRLFLTDSGQL